MKKILISFLMIVGLISVGFAFDIPAKPNRLVNDYIGLLRADQVQTLETKLLDFEQKTSIQMTIVVLDDLDNEEASQVATDIGQAWGVGQGSLDNGIVFLIVKYNQNAIEKLFNPKRGDWFIASGYGLEPYITDLDLKSIGESEFIPFAKEDKYYEGVDATASRIISKLGEIGWQQREELEAKRKIEAEEELRKFGNGLLSFLLYAVLIGLVLWLIVKSVKAYNAAQEIKRKREALKLDFAQQKKEYDALLSQTPQPTNYPAWAANIHNHHVKSIGAVTIDCNRIVEFFPEAVSGDLAEVVPLLKHFTKQVSYLRELVERLKQIPGEIETYKFGYSEKFKLAKEKYEEFSTVFAGYQEKGFLLPSFKTSLNERKVFLDAIREDMLSQEDRSRDVYLESGELYEKISEAIAQMEAFIQTKEDCNEVLVKITSKLNAFEKDKPAALLILQSLKQHYPNSVWGDLDRGYSLLDGFIKKAKEQKDEAQKKNSMEIQKFDEAKLLADKAKNQLDDALQALQDIHDRKKEVEKSRNSYSTLLATVAQSIASAKTKCSDSDVESTAKNHLIAAEKKHKEAEQLIAGSMINWLLVSSLLTEANNLAKASYLQATSDIKKAIKDREDAAAATAAAAIATAAALESSRRISYNNDTSSGGGSFGGFGGGSFGGGGAGGSW